MTAVVDSATAGSTFRFRKDHIVALDGLRGIAILMVLWAHMPLHVIESVDFARGVVNPGYWGVDIFFVLSGFLITRILLVDLKLRDGKLRDFFARRALRIFPIYYLLLLVIWIIRPNQDVGWAAVYLSNFYFAFNAVKTPIAHTWSLATEEHFYMLWPLLVAFLPVRWSHRTAWVLMGLAVVLTAATVHFLPEVGPRLVYRGSPYRMFSLLAGSVLAIHEIRVCSIPPKRRLVLLGTAFAVGVIAIGLGKLSGGGIGFLESVLVLVGYALTSTCIVALAMSFASHAWIAGMLNFAPLTGLGKISYGLYLYHFPIFILCGISRGGFSNHYLFGQVWLSIAVAVTLSIGLAFASYHLVEKRLLRLKRFFVTPALGHADNTPPTPTETDGKRLDRTIVEVTA